MTELVATAKGMLMVSRRKTAPIGQLSPKQLDWLARKHPGIFRNVFVPLERSK